ncbi:MBL fold metallo-hydrolase [Maribacter ulvicola]|uniref:Glyoxylase, beta-lactamase superfamily II n=1 Tax=Maribacter ulvicola TaxID=228959 RepID=A0A1N6Z6X3_9FLAO|nr:MBL fold metallo-hydrolase [Maribacter ulvicola]SIR22526.1 Glyoxylase, beta-lactamase superfamily II [Maribacter ulvicola]
MIIKQFEDKPLAHYSYAILSGNEMALVDPSRDPEPYYKFAEENNAKIVAVFETHPHADFVSGHLQIHKETDAVIYVSELVGADYPHKTFDDGATLKMNDVTFTAINTPGHSPDGITIVAKGNDDKQAMFTGDTLFIGDVGRPDLREKAGNMKAKREQLAKDMYHTMQNKFNHLSDDTLVYPAHGAGSLCGKNMSSDSSSTLRNERMGNWAFKTLTEEDFVDHILKDQPFIPSYFGHDVAINKTGAPNNIDAISQIPLQIGAFKIEKNILVIDTRDKAEFKKNHLPNSINIMARNIDDKIETWLGSIVEPSEPFYIVVASINDKQALLERIAKIGYESQVKAVLTLHKVYEKEDEFDFTDFDKNKENYTIVDIRNKSEFNDGHFFDSAINIPLNELRNAIDKIPTNKPIVIHCAGGYRSAAGSSIVSKQIHNTEVYDLSEKINNYKTKL